MTDLRRLCVVTGVSTLLVGALLAAVRSQAQDAGADDVASIGAGNGHLPESVRASLTRVVVLPRSGAADEAVTGTYEKVTPGLAGGISKGSQIGRGIGTDIGGIPVQIPFPILTFPGAVIGGIAGATERQLQEFRDALTKDLAKASSQPLTDDALAADVFWGLRELPEVQSRVLAPGVPVPEDTDAILYVSIGDMSINVQADEAIITTTAEATLRRVSDGEHLYERMVQYQDRDTLSNWTANDSALWHNYASFARHYIGREIVAETYQRVPLDQELAPRKTDDVSQVKRDEWRGSTKSLMPTLAWDLTLAGGNPDYPWADSIGEENIDWEIEIYDLQRPVYSADRIADRSHTVALALEPCKTYRWSVRPAYRLDGMTRYGPWMRKPGGEGNGNVGRKASEAAAYIQDFATLEVSCRAR